MSIEDSIQSELVKLRPWRPGRPLKHYIAHARFPNFKNISPNERIEFTFPLTILVGPNGAGKSSILQALFGMPKGYSTSRYWFDTAVDVIEGEKQNSPQRYIYGHWNDAANQIVETRKARVGSKDDYWEPTKVASADDMAAMPAGDFRGKSKDRWNPVERGVIYINIRHSFGSFDRFFLDDSQTNVQRREAARRQALHVRKIIDNKLATYHVHGTERLVANEELSEAELAEVAAVLGHSYNAARVIKHRLFPGARSQDMTVIFERHKSYTEAFAGSGELSAVKVVTEVLRAPDYSLILLDEPETSLHPSAQRALVLFLLTQIRKRKLQIVVSTHSPEFVRELPDDAIKIIEPNQHGLASINNRGSASIAFHRLGVVPSNRIRIIVEDTLAAALISRVFSLMDPGESNEMEVAVAPGGAQSLLCHLVPGFMAAGEKVFLFLDGDQRKELPAPGAIADSEVVAKARALAGGKIVANLAGDDSVGIKAQREIDYHHKYINWLQLHVAYLPLDTPEQIILETLPASTHVDADIKVRLRNVCGITKDFSSEQALGVLKLKINAISDDNSHLVEIRTQLQKWRRVGRQ